jgi:hypothetical protein
MRVVTVWASYGWAHGEGKDGPESKSKGDSAHPVVGQALPEYGRRSWDLSRFFEGISAYALSKHTVYGLIHMALVE